MELGTPLNELVATTHSDGAIGGVDLRIAGMPLRITAYGGVLALLGVRSYSGTYSENSKTAPKYLEQSAPAAFEFDYDWRRSLDENASRLHLFIRQAARFVQLERGEYNPVRFDVVAHSMGGLILRYFLKYGGQLLPLDGSLPRPNWIGAAWVQTAVIVGTPSAGSLFALERLVSGLPKSPLHPAYDPMIVGTMPAVYQLLPRNRHKPFTLRGSKNAGTDLYDPEFWKYMHWGLADTRRTNMLAALLPGIDSANKRIETALEHLKKCLLVSKAFHEALDVPSSKPESLQIHLVAGDKYPTPAAASAAPGDRRLRFDRFAPGDKVVLRSSALLDERVGGKWTPQLVSPLKWDSVFFLPANHLGLVHNPVFLDNLLYLLLERPRC